MLNRIRRIDWSYLFIFIFCVAYGIIANIQSRLYPIEGTMAFEVRRRVDYKLNRLIERHRCEEQVTDGELIWIWYENSDTNEYWCGFFDPYIVKDERLAELTPYIEILNSEANIRRITSNESNKHSSGQEDLQEAVNR